MKYLNKMMALTYCLSALSISWVNVSSSSAHAQSTKLEANSIQFTPPTLTDRGRPPGRLRGGASRGNCQFSENLPALTALAPTTQVSLAETGQASAASSLSNYESVLSLTTAAYPSFWFYVPPTLNDNVTLEFVLQDASGNTLYQTKFNASADNAGIVQFSLPEAASPITVNESYQWYFLTHCDLASTGDPPYVRGWTIRTSVDSDFQAQLEQASMLEKASLYAAHGIWQDAVTVLGELYRADPQNLTIRSNWLSLLRSVGLNEISEQPLTACCTLFHSP